MRSILITGGTGLLGKGMDETAHQDFKILSLHQREYAVESAKAEHWVLDIRDKARVDKLFEERQFDAVVHAAGIASVDFVERHYAESLESNIVGTLNITSASRRAGCHFVYISTNAVFDGTKAPYAEDAPINPVNKYGRLKAECERLVTETLKDYAIARPILMYGWNHAICRPNPATWILEKLKRGEAVQLVDDVYENPLYNVQCAEALWALLRKRATGMFHLAGGEVVNRFQFGRKVAQVFGLDGSLLKAVPSSAFPGIAKRPPDTSFITKRLERELGIRPYTVEEGLAHMKANAAPKL